MGKGSEATDWALAEFGAANLGDARRDARLVQLARQLGQRPEASLPRALQDRAALKAANNTAPKMTPGKWPKPPSTTMATIITDSIRLNDSGEINP